MKTKKWYVLAILLSVVAFGQPAQAVLNSVGPIDPNTGFPIWYRDTTGLSLELCVEQPVGAVDPCLLAGLVPTPGDPIVVPGNSPDELFWWSAGAIVPVAGGSADLVLGLEAAFNGGPVLAGDQVSFGRVRIRVDAPVAGDYRVTHPYGVNFFPNVAVGIRTINDTSDIGIALGSFRGALTSAIGPFLRWDTDYPFSFAEFPDMLFVGDPAVLHTVTGSPFGTNFFRVEADTDDPPDGIYETLVAETTLFSVMGKVFSGAIPVSILDFDLDGQTDIAVFRPADGTWYIVRSSDGTGTQVTWGQDGDIPVAGDYDGDGQTDIAVFRPADGNWYILRSSDSAGTQVAWGQNGDIPVPGNYDGDSKTDMAVWRPSDGSWYISRSSDATGVQAVWGQNGDIPVPGNYDGDSKTDMAVWRPSDGTWYVVRSLDGAGSTFVWGATDDVPFPGDFDGDGATDPSFYRYLGGATNLVNWYVLASGPYSVPFAKKIGAGLVLDVVPVVGDYDKDTLMDMGLFNVTTGFWNVHLSGGGPPVNVQWGAAGDIPISQVPWLSTFATVP